MAEVFGVVYDPPRAGFPYLAAVFMNGNLLHCEVVATLAEGETLLSATMNEMQKHVQPTTNIAQGWANRPKGGFRQSRKPMCWPVSGSSSSSF
jgi:hypothetical protein